MLSIGVPLRQGAVSSAGPSAVRAAPRLRRLLAEADREGHAMRGTERVHVPEGVIQLERPVADTRAHRELSEIGAAQVTGARRQEVREPDLTARAELEIL